MICRTAAKDVWYMSVYIAARSMQDRTRNPKPAKGEAQLDNGSHAVQGRTASNDSFSVTPLLAKVRRRA